MRQTLILIALVMAPALAACEPGQSNNQAVAPPPPTVTVAKPISKIELLTRVRCVLRLVHEIDRRRAREQELLEVMRQLQEANQMLLRLSCLDGLSEMPAWL